MLNNIFSENWRDKRKLKFVMYNGKKKVLSTFSLNILSYTEQNYIDFTIRSQFLNGGFHMNFA
jgi:hypothetical protein